MYGKTLLILPRNVKKMTENRGVFIKSLFNKGMTKSVRNSSDFRVTECLLLKKFNAHCSHHNLVK